MEPAKTVLIIDDDPTILETARRLLERDGLQVLVYNQAADATHFAARHCPDLVLIDVNMPVLSGDSVAALFKGHARLQATPLVLFSSNEEGALRRMAKAVGALGYISKAEMGTGFSRRVRGFLANSGG